MKPAVSVIIPTYNRAAYLAESIQSVLDQKLNKKLEIIVVDDGSTDNTAAIAKKFGKKIHYVKIPHSGYPAVARNAGLNLATGEFVAFQDSDDIWLKNKLAVQLPHFKDPSVVLVYSNALVMEQNGDITEQFLVDPKILKSGYVFKDLLKTNFISTSTVVVRRSVLQNVGGFNESDDLRGVEDYELWLRITGLKTGRVKAVKKPLLYYRRHDKSFSQASSVEALKRISTAYEYVWRYNQRLDKGYVVPLVDAMVAIQYRWDIAQTEEDPWSHPTVSVVMSVYNGAEHLRTAIHSILNQTFKNFEFIIIDDGSTDNSIGVIRSFNDPRIRVIQQPNKGLVDSLNLGVRLARAPLIARMDQDDISLPFRLEKELRSIISHPRIGLLGSFFSYIDQLNNSLSITIAFPTKNADLKREFYLVNPFGHGTVIFRKEAFEHVGGYRADYGPTEDFDLWRRIAEHWEISLIPEVLYLYRISPGSMSHQSSDVQHRYSDQIIKEQWGKPFVYKGYRDIIKDARYYHNLNSPYASTIYNQYTYDQYSIALEMLARGWAKSGTITALAAGRLDRALWRKIWRPIIGGFLKRVGLRPRKS